MKEHQVEAYLIRRVAELGGAQAKHTSPGTDGEPDRLVKLPGHPMAMLELKRPGQRPTERQVERIKHWSRHGVLAGWADSPASVEKFLMGVQQQGGIRITLTDEDRAAGWTVPEW
jgi:hypothetical protein